MIGTIEALLIASKKTGLEVKGKVIPITGLCGLEGG